MGDGAPEVEISGLAYSSQSVTPGALFFCVPGLPRRRPRLRARRRRARRRGAGLRAPAGARRARGGRARRAGGDGPRGRALPRRPHRRAARWSASPAPTARPPRPSSCATCSRPPGGPAACWARSSAWWAGWRRRWSAPRPRRSTCRPRSGACSTPATAPARWRSPRTRSSWAAPAGIRFACRVFTNLTQDHLDFHETMEAYFAAKRRLFDEPGPAVVNVDDELRPAPGRRARLRDVRDRARGRLPRARRAASTSPARAFTARRRTGSSSCARRCPGCSTCRTRSARWPRRARSACAETIAARAGVRPRARPLRARRRGPGLRRAGGLRPHARLARERAARRARADRRAPARGVRRGRRPRPRQAPADGPRRGASWPTA